MIAASATAQRLVLAYRHFGKDPYELYNEGSRDHVCTTCGRSRPDTDREVFCTGADEPHPPTMWVLAPLPPPPKPLLYRAFLEAAAVWAETKTAETAALRMIAGAMGG